MGLFDGVPVGFKVGMFVGDGDGLNVGAGVGSTDGSFVGISVGNGAEVTSKVNLFDFPFVCTTPTHSFRVSCRA